MVPTDEILISKYTHGLGTQSSLPGIILDKTKPTPLSLVGLLLNRHLQGCIDRLAERNGHSIHFQKVEAMHKTMCVTCGYFIRCRLTGKCYIVLHNGVVLDEHGKLNLLSAERDMSTKHTRNVEMQSIFRRTSSLQSAMP